MSLPSSTIAAKGAQDLALAAEIGEFAREECRTALAGDPLLDPLL